MLTEICFGSICSKKILKLRDLNYLGVITVFQYSTGSSITLSTYVQKTIATEGANTANDVTDTLVGIYDILNSN